MIGAARVDADKNARLGLAARRGHGANRKDEILGSEKDDPYVAVLMPRIGTG